MKKVNRTEIVEFLTELSENGPREGREYQGVCTLLENKFDVDIDDIPEKVYTSWEHFSGSCSYPVPSTYSNRSARGKYSATRNKWKGKYGELRKLWCKHLAEYFENCEDHELLKIYS